MDPSVTRAILVRMGCHATRDTYDLIICETKAPGTYPIPFFSHRATPSARGVKGKGYARSALARHCPRRMRRILKALASVFGSIISLLFLPFAHYHLLRLAYHLSFHSLLYPLTMALNYTQLPQRAHTCPLRLKRKNERKTVTARAGHYFVTAPIKYNTL